jgi:hypothetical protein
MYFIKKSAGYNIPDGKINEEMRELQISQKTELIE